jgi:hypothetical protein
MTMIRASRNSLRPTASGDHPETGAASDNARRTRKEEVMPMDRPDRVDSIPKLACLLAVLFLGCAGCRSTRSEVPPGKPYQTTGSTPPSVGFSSEAHPSTATGMAGLYGNKGPGALVQDVQSSAAPSAGVTYGIPAPGATNLGAPTDNRYGPPGSSGTDGSSPSIASSLLKAIPPASKMLEKDPEATPASGTSLPSGYP